MDFSVFLHYNQNKVGQNSDEGTAATAPPPFRLGDPALRGSRPLVTP